MDCRPLLLLVALFFSPPSHASPTGHFIKHLSSLLNWPSLATPATPASPAADSLAFESGYLVETLIEGSSNSNLGVVPHTIRVAPEGGGGDLFAVDAASSNIVRITPPLSHYSRARLVAGSFQGFPGHVDGKPADARFNRPKGVAMDGKGNVYVADTANFAIRKIGEAGVTTIAGGKSSIAGYQDGPSEDAKFSSDFDVVYVESMCSLLVVDRGNAALRQISLQQEDCDYQSSSVSASEGIRETGEGNLMIEAVQKKYIGSSLHWRQHGFGSSSSTKEKQTFESEQQDLTTMEKPTLIVESLQEDPVAGWPSFGRLVADLLRLAIEATGSLFINFIPSGLRSLGAKKNLTPLKDRLVMPEDNAEPSLVQKQISSPAMPETLHASTIRTDTLPKPQKSSKPPKFKDPSLSGKHRSSKRQEFAEFYGTGDSPAVSSKTQKDRVRHRHRDKSGEFTAGAVRMEPKPVETKPVDYVDPKFDHYNIRRKYGADNAFNF